MRDTITTITTIILAILCLASFGGCVTLIGYESLLVLDYFGILEKVVWVLCDHTYFDLVIPLTCLLCIYMMWSIGLGAKDPGDDEMVLLFLGLLVGFGTSVIYQLGKVYFPVEMDGLQHDKAALLLSLLVTILGSITLAVRLRNINEDTKTMMVCYSLIGMFVTGALAIGTLAGLGGIHILELAAKGAGI